MKKKLVTQKNLIICLSVMVVLLVTLVLFFTVGKKISFGSGKGKKKITTEYKYSFNTMANTLNELSEDQKVIAKYFDRSYYELWSYKEIVQYADMLKGLKVGSTCYIYSFLSTDDDSYEAICIFAFGEQDGPFDIEDEVKKEELFIIKGKKPEKMFMKADGVDLIGRLAGTKTVKVDGKNMYLPVIEVEEITTDFRFSDDLIRKVAKIVFGNDIKVRRPTEEESTKMANDYFYSFTDSFFLIELENKSNNNFKVFDIWQSLGYGFISYNAMYNEGIESDYLNKYLYITPDLQKYIVFDMSRIDKYVYINVYDRNYKKLWSREISNVSQITWDATDTELVFVSDNDLYQIDLKTGKDIKEPILVDDRISVTMVENGYILLSDSSDDTVMFMNKNGKILNKIDVDINPFNKEYVSVSVQELNNQYVIMYNYPINERTFEQVTKYIIIDKKGNLVKATDN